MELEQAAASFPGAHGRGSKLGSGREESEMHAPGVESDVHETRAEDMGDDGQFRVRGVQPLGVGKRLQA